MDETSTALAANAPDLTTVYNEAFYKAITLESLNSARIFLGYLWTYFQPDSVLDVGCGRGAWLKACHELGSKELFGFDGGWNNQSMMMDDSIAFESVVLNKPFSLHKRVDLVVTLEVAEHLKPSFSQQFIQCLVDASDVVLFSAAYTGQGGTNHINERPHSYWAELFIKNEYVPFDLFRPVFWGDERLGFWYRQNIFLYLKKNSSAYQKFKNAQFSELTEIEFMNCIHPRLYEMKCGSGVGFKTHVKNLIPSLYKAIKRRFGSGYCGNNTGS